MRDRPHAGSHLGLRRRPATKEDNPKQARIAALAAILFAAIDTGCVSSSLVVAHHDAVVIDPADRTVTFTGGHSLTGRDGGPIPRVGMADCAGGISVKETLEAAVAGGWTVRVRDEPDVEIALPIGVGLPERERVFQTAAFSERGSPRILGDRRGVEE